MPTTAQLLVVLFLVFAANLTNGFRLHPPTRMRSMNIGSTEVSGPEGTITSPKIEKLQKKLASLQADLVAVRAEKAREQDALKQLDEEYGAEIARVRKEFKRMKERSYEEAADVSNKAKVDALKEVLPLMDNYIRAKKVFDPLETDEEQRIGNTYDELFTSFGKILEEFGVQRVISLGQPFDVKFMEAIMTAPSTEYGKDLVCTEYQVGYRMGDSCVRPAMVVVSLGPGPSS